MELDVAGRRARVEIPGIGGSRAAPIIDPISGNKFRASFGAPGGFQPTEAEMGNGSTDLEAGIVGHLSGGRAHFARLRMNQDGASGKPRTPMTARLASRTRAWHAARHDE